MNKKVEAKCEECGNEFLFDTLDVIVKENVKIEDSTFTIIYYKCPECGAIQLVGMLNYLAKRIRDKYFTAYNSVKKMEASGQSKSKLFIYKQRLEKLEKLKEENTDYQMQLISKYRDKIPTEIFEEADTIES